MLKIFFLTLIALPLFGMELSLEESESNTKSNYQIIWNEEGAEPTLMVRCNLEKPCSKPPHFFVYYATLDHPEHLCRCTINCSYGKFKEFTKFIEESNCWEFMYKFDGDEVNLGFYLFRPEEFRFAIPDFMKKRIKDELSIKSIEAHKIKHVIEKDWQIIRLFLMLKTSDCDFCLIDAPRELFELICDILVSIRKSTLTWPEPRH